VKPRVKMLPPRLKAAPMRAQPGVQPERYGKGRGGRPWRRLRDQILLRDQYQCRCDQCERLPPLQRAPANEVDHIVPLSEGGSDDPSNLRAINDEHHKPKTQAEARRARRVGPGG
jgi:5-methylcytosine-specific restriction protein A